MLLTKAHSAGTCAANKLTGSSRQLLHQLDCSTYHGTRVRTRIRTYVRTRARTMVRTHEYERVYVHVRVLEYSYTYKCTSYR